MDFIDFIKLMTEFQMKMNLDFNIYIGIPYLDKGGVDKCFSIFLSVLFSSF